MPKKLEIRITKEYDDVKLEYTDGADIHEMIGLLGTTMNHLTMQAQGFDITKVSKELFTKLTTEGKVDVSEYLIGHADDFVEFLDSNIEGMVDSHLDSWKSRYYRKSIADIRTELYVNHDLTADIEYVVRELCRELTQEEIDAFESYFNESVINEFR